MLRCVDRFMRHEAHSRCPCLKVTFRALCTGTEPGFDPRHQGGEGVAGSPGVRLPGDLPPELTARMQWYRQRIVVIAPPHPPLHTQTHSPTQTTTTHPRSHTHSYVISPSRNGVKLNKDFSETCPKPVPLAVISPDSRQGQWESLSSIHARH